jgi:hypothetical protein
MSSLSLKLHNDSQKIKRQMMVVAIRKKKKGKEGSG